jgi:hypothetical protein
LLFEILIEFLRLLLGNLFDLLLSGCGLISSSVFLVEISKFISFFKANPFGFVTIRFGTGTRAVVPR